MNISIRKNDKNTSEAYSVARTMRSANGTGYLYRRRSISFYETPTHTSEIHHHKSFFLQRKARTHETGLKTRRPVNNALSSASPSRSSSFEVGALTLPSVPLLFVPLALALLPLTFLAIPLATRLSTPFVCMRRYS